MDRFGEWRPIQAADDDGESSPPHEPAKPADPAGPEANAFSVRLLGLLGAGVLGVVGLVVWFTAPSGGAKLDVRSAAGFLGAAPSLAVDGASAFAPSAQPELVVDVEGAVAQPGVHRLAPGSRVGDAIARAGGYSAQVDLDAASAVLNLAAPLTDGAKIHVPARGAAALGNATAGRAPDPSSHGGSALIDVNVAAVDELDTLPGIGPVTAGKIIAAREQARFATVDELLSRGVVGASTFEKIRALVTVNP
jgi:competence protein ComEA